MALPTDKKSINCKSKKRYPTKETADKVINKAWKQSKPIISDNLKRPLRSYLCYECDAWHLTSKPEWSNNGK